MCFVYIFQWVRHEERVLGWEVEGGGRLSDAWQSWHDSRVSSREGEGGREGDRESPGTWWRMSSLSYLNLHLHLSGNFWLFHPLFFTFVPKSSVSVFITFRTPVFPHSSSSHLRFSPTFPKTHHLSPYQTIPGSPPVVATSFHSSSPTSIQGSTSMERGIRELLDEAQRGIQWENYNFSCVLRTVLNIWSHYKERF